MSRVTLVVNNFDEGSETFLHRLSGHLRSAGHEVTVHALVDRGVAVRAGGDGFVEVERSHALPTVRSRSFAGSLSLLAAKDGSCIVAAMRRALRRFGAGTRAARAGLLAAPLLATRPDVVHLAFSGIGVTLVDALELLNPGTKIVVSCRGSGELVLPHLHPSTRSELERLLSRADAVHAVTDVVASAAIDLGARPDRVTVIRAGVEIWPEVRRVPRGACRPVRLLTVSRLHWIKSIETQLDAVALLGDVGTQVELCVVGDGPRAEELRFRAHAMGLGEAVRFCGALPPSEVRHLLVGADVYLSSSLSEGVSNSVLEAMAAGVPVVATPAGGMVDLLQHGVNAMVVPIGDPGSIARAVERISDDPDLASRLVTGAQRTVAARFAVGRQEREFVEFYESLLTNHPDLGSS